MLLFEISVEAHDKRDCFSWHQKLWVAGMSPSWKNAVWWDANIVSKNLRVARGER